MHTVAAYRHYLGVPFDRGERWKLVVSVVCSIGTALLDAVAIDLVVPAGLEG
ncbi:hypothetical protein [Actinomyces sp. MRS3W]|uniref:hypothetical protein n=1 Tax=Actinomyces sp. MRS3W TaxID=2800796 RepID=UPI0028FD9DFE|nr:hypothetical protein [Actinomyces sp. MRS3W]MDU0348250.1 hypothetical protein [Actinomyces sp. MRS3W]